jgi:hypothetical protein
MELSSYIEYPSIKKKEEKEELSWTLNKAMMVKHKATICIKQKSISIGNFRPLIQQT